MRVHRADQPSIARSSTMASPTPIRDGDVSMPGLDGLTVCHAIHRSAATWDIPVLILSARARPYDIDLRFAIGADDYLTKPFSPAELVQRVESPLEAAI
ncbi:response regulator transcription factor [Actinoplanes sp. TFC3]|uniref:response regulator transcription factor n=1 Tax=Actinoplanes sp. TFC3 TaxID=1710355 RepID=UPI00351330E3